MENKDFKTLTEFISKESDVLSAIYKWVIYIGSSLLAFFKLELMLFLFIFMMADTLWGVVASWSLGEKLEKRKFAIGMLTKIAVLIVPLTVSILGYVYVVVYDSDYNFKWILDFTIVIILANEALSLFANIITLITGKRVKNIDYVEKLLNLIRVALTYFVEKLLDSFKIEDKNEKK